MKKYAVLMLLGCNIEAQAGEINTRRDLLHPIVLNNQAVNNAIDEQLTCSEILKAGVATCCFPCLLLFSELILRYKIKND